MTDPRIGRRVEEGVVTIELNNPPLNIFTVSMMEGLSEILAEVKGSDSVTAVIVTSTGERSFCAGSDVREMAQMKRSGTLLSHKLKPENDVYTALDHLPKPTIAVVKGMALGGGLELAACCDLIVVEEDALLSLPEINLGWFPGSGGTVRIVRRIGEARAKEMMFFGKPITAHVALDWGLVNRVVPRGNGLSTAKALAAELSARSSSALALCKQAIDLAFDVEEGEAVRQTTLLINAALSTEDADEGIRAFFAKEAPRFRSKGKLTDGAGER